MCHIRSTAARVRQWRRGAWRGLLSEEGSYLRLMDFLYHSTLVLRVIKQKKKKAERPVGGGGAESGQQVPGGVQGGDGGSEEQEREEVDEGLDYQLAETVTSKP